MTHCISTHSWISKLYFFQGADYIINNFHSNKFINCDKPSIEPTTAITGFFIETDTIINNMRIFVDHLQDVLLLPAFPLENHILKYNHNLIKQIGQIIIDPDNETIKDMIQKILSPNLCSDIIDNIIQPYINKKYLYWIPMHDLDDKSIKNTPWNSNKNIYIKPSSGWNNQITFIFDHPRDCTIYSLESKRICLIDNMPVIKNYY